MSDQNTDVNEEFGALHIVASNLTVAFYTARKWQNPVFQSEVLKTYQEFVKLLKGEGEEELPNTPARPRTLGGF